MRIQPSNQISVDLPASKGLSGSLINVKSRRARILFHDEADYIIFHALLRQHIRLFKYPGLVAYSVSERQYCLLFQGSNGQQLVRALNLAYTAYHFRRYQLTYALFYDVYKSTLLEYSNLLVSISQSMHADTKAHWLYSSVSYYQARYPPDWLEVMAHCRLAGGRSTYLKQLRAQKNRPGGAILRRSMRS